METSGRKALVIGATGLVGSLLVHRLLRQPEYGLVRILVRKRLDLDHPKLEQYVVDWDQLGDARNLFYPMDDLYCCLGTTIKKQAVRNNFARSIFTIR